MIKLERTNVMNFENAIRGARNPMNSWDKMDSYFANYTDASGMTYKQLDSYDDITTDWMTLGENDLNLAKRLVKAGSDHRKFLRQILVSVDITAPLYWWPEYDTYKVGTVANSCSRMHKLLSKPFEMSDFSFDKLSGYKNEVKQFKPDVDEETEIWKKIDCDYDVSNQGRVRHGARILSGSLHKDGYIFVTIHGLQKPVHRYVAEAFVLNVENKPEVNHKDGNKQNNKADNLEWATRSENQTHAVTNSLQPIQTNTYKGKFTQEQRDEIKNLWDNGGISRRKLASMYGVSHTCINDIINDKYKYANKINLYEEVARPLVDMLNELRDAYFRCENEDDKKEIWYSIIQLLPESYNQLRTCTLNYEVLFNQYHARKHHKLDEWHTYCDWIETLPYFKEMCLEEKTDGE